MPPLAVIAGICAALLWPMQQHRAWTAIIWQAESAQQPAAADSPSQQNPDQAPAPQANQNPSNTPCSEAHPTDSTAGNSTTKSPCKKTRKARSQKTTTTSTTTTPAKTVVRNGSTSDTAVALAPSGTQQQAPQTLQDTNQLLATSDANLKRISGRELSPGQQDTVTQIKSYMKQARSAADSGDLQRAYNLAYKANLLSADLAGH